MSKDVTIKEALEGEIVRRRKDDNTLRWEYTIYHGSLGDKLLPIAVALAFITIALMFMGVLPLK